MSDTITRDEWLAALELAQASRPADDPGMTTEELCELWCMNAKRVCVVLQSINRTGRLSTGVRYGRRIDGRGKITPTYRITP